MNIHILAGGPASLVPDLPEGHTDEVIWIGVDRGVFSLLEANVQPAYAFGDFDSVSSEQIRWLEEHQSNVKVFPRAKDKTDLELALEWSLEQQPDRIRIFGATGGRLDHELANVSLLLRGIEFGVPVQMIDRNNIVEAQKPGTYELTQSDDYQYVSFLPFLTQIKGLTLKGFKYPLHAQDLFHGSTLTVSNELCEEKGTYSFAEGIVLVIRSRDGLQG